MLEQESLIVDQTDNKMDLSGKVVLVNIFTPKPGMLEDFIKAQSAEYLRLKGKVEGALGNRLCKSVDGTKAVNLAWFDSLENYNKWRDSQLFADHMKLIKPFIEQSAPGIYEVIYNSGGDFLV